MVKPKLTKKGWRASIYLGKNIYGKKKYKDIYAKSEDECNKKIIDYLYMKNNNLLNENLKIENEDFNSMYEKYVQNRVNITTNTKNDYISTKDKYFKPLLKMNLKDINEDVLQELYNSILKKHGDSLVLRIDKFLNSFFNSMVKKKKIQYNPLNLVEKPKKKKSKHYECTKDELNNIINLLKKDENYNYLYMIILIQSCTGTRISETLAIDINKSIDFENNTLNIVQQQSKEKGKGYYIKEDLKTDPSKRKIPILKPVMQEIKKHIYIQNQYFKFNKITKDEQYKDLLFLNDKGTMRKENTVHRHWKTFKEKNNINPELDLHDFRRFFATWLMQQGVPDKIAKNLLGHSKIDMTQYYQNNDDSYTMDLLQEKELYINF